MDTLGGVVLGETKSGASLNNTKAKKFTRLALDRHHKLLREMPDRAQQRSAAVDQRMAMLRATGALSLRMEADRAREAVHSLPAGL